MGRGLGMPFIWVWRAVGLRWLPARARLPLALTLLYATAAALLWRLLPPTPRLVVELPDRVAGVQEMAQGGGAAVAFCHTKDGNPNLPPLVFDLRHGSWFKPAYGDRGGIWHMQL